MSFAAAGVQIQNDRVAAIREVWFCAMSTHESPYILDPREVQEVQEVRLTRCPSTRLRVGVR
jgi:hypothetical protein